MLETRSKMLQRHKLELRNLQLAGKRKLGSVSNKKKDQKRELIRANELAEQELAQRHQDELAKRDADEAAQDIHNDDDGAENDDDDSAAEVETAPSSSAVAEQTAAGDGGSATAPAPASAESDAPVPAAGRGGGKKSRAARRRELQAAREEEREAEAEREKEVFRESGLDARDNEQKALEAQLARLHLSIVDVPADGNCMYAAIRDQLARGTAANGGGAHAASECGVDGEAALAAERAVQSMAAVRLACKEQMEAHPDLYAPFLALDADGDDGLNFAGYCERVAHSTAWGGHVELMALANAFQRPIHVYRANQAEPLVIEPQPSAADGPEPAAQRCCVSPMLLSYHQFVYTLGEHYNSVRPS